MDRIYFTLFCAAVVGIFGTFLTNDGDLLVNSFEIDALHIGQAVLRLLDGEVQHIDFHTPLGFLAFLPAKLLMQNGFGFGAAVAYGNLLIALAFLPALLWVGMTRFSGFPRYGFALVTLILFLALNMGGIRPTGLDMALFYNRWCWGVAGIAIALVVLSGPQRRSFRAVDGVFLGQCLSFLALTKASFFVYLFPPILLGLAIFIRVRCAVYALLTGAAILGLTVVLTGGPDQMLAYVGDLLAVYHGELRDAPSLGAFGVSLAPELIVGNMALLAGAVFLRGAGRPREGLFLLLLFPGIVMATVQNWGNYNQWSFALAFILLALAGQIYREYRAGVLMSGAVLLAVALPQIISMGLSTAIHAVTPTNLYGPVLADSRFADFKAPLVRLDAATLQTKMGFEADGSAIPEIPSKRSGSFRGEDFPDCKVAGAGLSHLNAVSRSLEQDPNMSGQRVLVAAVTSIYWMFGDTERLPGAQLWYYGGDTGFEGADYLVVPFCTYGSKGHQARQAILDNIENSGRYKFTEVDRNTLYILLERDRSAEGL